MTLDMRSSCAPFADEFWALVDRTGGPDACWPWLGTRNEHGYGVFRHTRAHRVALNLAKGPYVDKLKGLHSCDNRPCCNPAHLRAGTQRENTADAIARKRFKFNHKLRVSDCDAMIVRTLYRLGCPSRRISEIKQIGIATVFNILRAGRWPGLEKVSKPPISEVDRAEIMALRGSGLKQRAVAHRFGVSRSAISLLWNGKTGQRRNRAAA